jgi:hypothetical protein
MKNYIIVVLLMMFMIPVVFSDTYTDFSRPFVQTKVYSGVSGYLYTDESYLLRSTENNTGINYNYAGFEPCTVVVGANNGGVPFSFYDYSSIYEHHSFILITNTSIRQYDSSCNKIDERNVSGTIVSDLAIINKGYVGEYYYSPYFAFAYNRSSDSNVYLRIYNLDAEIGMLNWVQDVLIGTDSDWGYKNLNTGVAGGNLRSNGLDPGYERVFGIYSNKTKELFISGGWGAGDYIDFSETVKVDLSANSMTEPSNELYFDDVNNDGWNEFAILGAYQNGGDTDLYIEQVYVQPLTYAPYYDLIGDIDVKVLTLGVGTVGYIQNSDGWITLCQVGDVDSDLEVCYNFNVHMNPDEFPTSVKGFIRDFISPSTVYHSSSEISIEPFTIKDKNGTYDYCFNYDSNTYKCYDGSGNMDFEFDTTKNLHVTGTTDSIKVLVTELNGITKDYEILFSSGEVETINRTSSSTHVLTDWNTLFTDSNTGNLFAQDISSDGLSELIYIDDNYLKIYSMDNTPFTIIDGTYLLNGTPSTTTTTSSTTTTTINADLPEIFSNVQNNINPIIGLILVIGLCILVATRTQSVIIICLAAVVGVMLSTFLGLFSSSVVVLMVLIIIALAVLGLTLFRNGGG